LFHFLSLFVFRVKKEKSPVQKGRPAGRLAAEQKTTGLFDFARGKNLKSPVFPDGGSASGSVQW
jgi:hypothetical protein